MERKSGNRECLRPNLKLANTWQQPASPVESWRHANCSFAGSGGTTPRSITFHPVSLAVGVSLGAIIALALSAAQLTAPASHLPRVPVDGVPAPSEMVRLVAADFPYTVPASATLVITSVGQLRTSGYGLSSAEVSIGVNGQEMLFVSTMASDPFISGTIVGGKCEKITPGLVFQAGTVVTATTPIPTASTAPFVILGYLSPR